jgi:hypothetical protein
MLIIRGKWRRRGIAALAAVIATSAVLLIFCGIARPNGYETTQSRLNTSIVESAFDGISLESAFQLISRNATVRIIVDWDALRQHNLDRDDQFHARSRRIPCSLLLRIILSDASAIATAPLVTTIGDDGVVHVTTEDHLAEYVVEQRYDLRWLFPVVPTGPHLSESRATIARLLKDVIAPRTWTDFRGTTGSMRWEGGWLIVVQTPENQRAMERVILQLRDRRSAPPLLHVAREMEIAW